MREASPGDARTNRSPPKIGYDSAMFSIESTGSVFHHSRSSRSLKSFLFLVLVGSILGLASPVAAQTSMNRVTDAQGNLVFQVGEEGGLLALGKFGRGTIPVEGAGTRLLWYPGKAAFRAGRVGFGLSDSTEWNAPNVGPYSVAFGLGTRAQGRGAVAMGQGATASGGQALALGYRASATGLRAAAFGDMTRAVGNFSTALGLHTTARASNSLAFGRWNVRGGTPDEWRPQDPLLVVGNGSGPSDRSNALLLRKNGNMMIAGALTQHSDRRLKTDIRPLESVGAALDRLSPVRFRFEAGTGHPRTPQIGLLAQDVQAEFPSLVQDGADGYLSLAYPKLTAVLLKGLQEQRARIDSLERRMQRLERVERRQDRLAEQVAVLQARERGLVSTLLSIDGRAAGSGALLLLLGGLLGAALARR